MELPYQAKYDIVSIDDEGHMTASSDGIDFSSSLSLDKKTSDKYLILALVYELCSYIEPSTPTNGNDTLAKFFLRHLVRRKLIPEYLVTMKDDINGFRHAFRKLISQITGEITDYFSHGGSSALVNCKAVHDRNNHTVNAPRSNILFDITPTIPRFRIDFKVIKTLGRGGFGQVFQAQHNIDGIAYAIKRVNMKDRKPACNVLREVKILAKLDHPNIVRYHNCWLEADFSCRRRSNRIEELRHNPDQSNNRFSKEGSLCKRSREDNDDFDIVFEKSISNGSSRNQTADSDMPLIPETPSISQDPVYSSSFPESNAMSRFTNHMQVANVERRGPSQCGLILNIQMQCCDGDLSQKLQSRTKIDVQENVRIMKELLSGLDYLHSHNIIHRDVKPSNLFFVQKTLQIGDVGLSRYYDKMDKHNLNETPNSPKTELLDSFIFNEELTRSVGTHLYSAPETHGNSGYRYKCSADIYSSGIVFYEIFNIFGTSMERIESINAVRDENIPLEFAQNYPEVAKLVGAMTSPEPERRPTAADLLKNSLFQDSGSINFIKQLQSQIQKLEKHRDSLKRKLDDERALSKQLRWELSGCTCRTQRFEEVLM